MTIIILFFPAHQRLIFIYHQNPQPALNYEGGKEERRREGERRGGPGAAAAAAAASASVFKSHLITALPLMDTPDCCWVLYLQEAQAHVSSQLYLLFMVITIEWLRRLQLIALCWGLRPRRRGGGKGGDTQGFAETTFGSAPSGSRVFTPLSSFSFVGQRKCETN